MASYMGNKLSVIIVDDDRDEFLILTTALSKISKSFNVQHVSDGELFIKILATAKPGMVFLNLRMPVMDGHQCLVEIRKNFSYHDLPVIIYSSMEDNNTTRQCQAEGANRFLIKTGSMIELHNLLLQLFKDDEAGYSTQNFVLRSSGSLREL